MSPRRKGALALTGRMLGMNVRELDGDCYVLEDPAARRRVTRIGGRTDLLTAAEDRKQQPRVQQQIARFLLGEQVVRLLKATDANCVLDVGANAGQFARGLRRAGYRGRIVSFEPVAGTFARLARRAADDPAWDVHQYALGAADGSAEIHTGDRLSSLLSPSDFGLEWKSRMGEMEAETIAVRRLDSVFDEVTSALTEELGEVRAFLKMDTQGYDLQVLEGAGDALRHVVALQSEVACLPLYDGMPRLPEQLSTYEAAGFQTVGIFPVTQHPATMRAIEMDLLMVRPGEVRRGRARRTA
jgi:FkbM family methyltransferase